MKTYVLTHNEVAGLHYWKNAPPPVEYLRNRHRHIFMIDCKFMVKHDDRDVEIIMQQDEVENFILQNFGSPAMFGEMSCEMIAKRILQRFENCISCRVLEDGFGGALCERK